MRRQSPAIAREAAEKLAVEALSFLASDPERIGRFLALSGLGPGDLRRIAGEPARVTRADCRMDLRTVPKPEETAKFRDPAILRDFLR